MNANLAARGHEMEGDFGERMMRVETKLEGVERDIVEIKTDLRAASLELKADLKELRKKVDPLNVGMAELKIMVAANTATLASAKGIFLRLLVVISTAVIGLVVRAAWELWA